MTNKLRSCFVALRRGRRTILAVAECNVWRPPWRQLFLGHVPSTVYWELFPHLYESALTQQHPLILQRRRWIRHCTCRGLNLTRADKGAITRKIKHAIKHKTSAAKLAQLLQPSLEFCSSLQPMTAYHPVLDGTPYAVIGCKLQQNANEGYNGCATVVQVLQDSFQVLLHVLFYLWSLLKLCISRGFSDHAAAAATCCGCLAADGRGGVAASWSRRHPSYDIKRK